MLGRTVLFGLVAILAVAYHAAGLLSLASKRRRDARALRRFVVRDIEAGRRSGTDRAVADVLSWCDEVSRTGHDVPLVATHRPPLVTITSAR